MPHHPKHLQTKSTTENRVTPLVTIDGVTYGGTRYDVDVMRRDYYGYTIVSESGEGCECVYIEGVDGDFGSDEDAADYIDELLGEGNDNEEHRLRKWQLV